MTNFNFYNANKAYGELYLQFPRVLLYNDKYFNLSDSAKIAYMTFRDRLQYSLKNNWIDENNNVYFIFTNKELCDLLKKSEPTAIKIKKELEEAELLLQKKMGFDPVAGKNYPNRLYLADLEVTATDIYQLQKMDETLATSGTKDSLVRPSSTETPINQGTKDSLVRPNEPETLATSGTKDSLVDLYLINSFKDNKDNKESQNTDFPKNSSFNNAFKNVVPESEQDLVTAYIKQNGLEEMYGQNFINILKMRAKDDLSLFVETMNAINHSLRSAEQELGYTIGVHFYEGSMYSEPLREDFTTTLYTVLLKIRTDHKVKDAKSYFFISFKNTAAYWVKKIMEDANQFTK